MYVEYSNTLEGGIPFLLPLQKAKATHAATPTAAIITSTAILTPTDRGTGNQFIKHHLLVKQSVAVLDYAPIILSCSR